MCAVPAARSRQASRTIPSNSTPGRYLGPYYIVRRTSDGVIDARFGQRLRQRLYY
jgi:hypothetical protein